MRATASCAIARTTASVFSVSVIQLHSGAPALTKWVRPADSTHVQDAATGEPRSGRRANSALRVRHAAPTDALTAIRDAGPPLLLIDDEGCVVMATAAALPLWPRSPEGRHLHDLFDDTHGKALAAAVSAGLEWEGYVATS